jgi:hypothetical protein
LESNTKISKIDFCEGGADGRSDLIPCTETEYSESSLCSSTQKMFRVTTNVLSQIDISKGSLIRVEMNEAVLKDLKMGCVVVASMPLEPKTPNALLLRQHILPHLLVTNSSPDNAPPIHILKSNARIIGVVLNKDGGSII